MPAKKKTEETKTNEFAFIDFNDQFGNDDLKINLSGRLYPPKENKGIKRSYLSLTVNGLLTISGCYFVETSNNYFVTFPQYTVEKDGKKEYKSYIYVGKDTFFSECLEQLAEVLIALSAKF